MHSSKRVLIISNNALSYTSNNGKTVWSLFEEYPRECLFQLFTRDEVPTIDIGGYFKLTNQNVIMGRVCKNKRGKVVKPNTDINEVQIIKTSRIKRTSFNCLVREIVWAGVWKSKQLDEWLEKINPEILFFVAGDTEYSYSICEYIAKKTGAEINIYITDDYIIPRSNEGIFDSIKRKRIFKRLNKILPRTKSFFTISEKMRKEYFLIFNKDSMPIFNVSENLRIENRSKSDNSQILITYAGSLYYGRADVLYEVAKCISEINKTYHLNINLEIYSGQEISDKLKDKLTINDASCFCGALNKKDLKCKLNESTIVLFVESFDIDQIEKTRFSLSTKISEYMSVEKPIIAIGPKEIGSMEFLSDVAICIYDTNEIKETILSLANNINEQNEYAYKARSKYEAMGDIHSIRSVFIRKLCDF